MKLTTRLNKGLFTDMDQEWHSDGTVTIELKDRNTKKQYKARIKDLYGPNEEEVDIETGRSIT